MVQCVCVISAFCFLMISYGFCITDKDEMERVTAVEGHHADLSCDLGSDQTTDTPILVLWFKDKSRTPVYRFELSGHTGSNSGDIASDDGLRVTLLRHLHPARLRISGVKKSDSGLYRCRIDFRSSPTINRWINLHVIVPPDKPVVEYDWPDGTQTRLNDKTIGPIPEGSPLTVSCYSRSGKPRPRVRWYRGGSLLDATDVVDGRRDRVSNVMHLPPLSRQDLAARLVCSASNNNISAPVTTSALIDMYFRPLSVEILGSPEIIVSAGRPYRIVCMTSGSRPPARISWWIQDTRLKDSVDKISANDNITSSTLMYTPSESEDGKLLRCIATHPALERFSLTHTRPVTVKYPPRISLALGSALNADDIKEGGDVYFECEVRANPAIYSMKWMLNDIAVVQHRGRVGSHGGTDLVTIGETTLIIRNISRASSGEYICRASNSEGDGISRPVPLRVQHAPVCHQQQKSHYYVSPGKRAAIVCQVSAHPPQVRIHWLIKTSNNSSPAIAPPLSSFSIGQNGTLIFAPKTRSDYGIVLCQAENQIGKMMIPCQYQTMPSEAPRAVKNCTVRNRTATALLVQCAVHQPASSSSNIGDHDQLHRHITQLFVAEVSDQTSGQLLQNITSRQLPRFQITGLPAGRSISVEVYSVNEGGRSGAVLLDTAVLQAAEQRIDSGELAEDTTLEVSTLAPLFGVLVGIALCFVLLTIAVVVIIKRSRGRSQQPKDARAQGSSKNDSEDPIDFMNGLGTDSRHCNGSPLNCSPLGNYTSVDPVTTGLHQRTRQTNGTAYEMEHLMMQPDSPLSNSTHHCRNMTDPAMQLSFCRPIGLTAATVTRLAQPNEMQHWNGDCKGHASWRPGRVRKLPTVAARSATLAHGRDRESVV